MSYCATANYLPFNRSGFCLRLRQATAMTATLPADSVWNRKTRRVCHLSSRCPLVVSSCQLVAASPLVVLSWSHQLVVALPLVILSLVCHPLVLLSRQLVVASPLLVLSLLRPLVPISWSLHCLSTCHPLVVSLHHPMCRHVVVVFSDTKNIASKKRQLM